MEAICMGYDKKKNRSVVGIFMDRPDMERAIDDLKKEGFKHTDISVLVQSHSESKKVADIKGVEALDGGFLISVHTNDRESAGKVQDLLLSCGAWEISDVGELEERVQYPSEKDVSLSRGGGYGYGSGSERVTSRDV